eukprot:3457821-Karenia_brevis.AAC.1
MRTDLRNDGVPVPGSPLQAMHDERERWMLYMPGELMQDKAVAPEGNVREISGPGQPAALQTKASSLTCPPCRTCRSALGASTPRMPWKARARG